MCKLIFAFFLVGLFFQCKVKEATRGPSRIEINETKIYLQNPDGSYIQADLKENEFPVPTQGKEQMELYLAGALKYPSSARQNGEEGVVVLQATVNRNGEIVDVEIKDSVSPELDSAVLTAYKQATVQGYQPFYYAEAILGFRIELPIEFRL